MQDTRRAVPVRADEQRGAGREGELDLVGSVHFDAALDAIGDTRVWAFSARATRSFWDVDYRPGDTLLFGGETRGLPPELIARFPAEQHLQIPITDDIRSHNLANAVSIALYEALRQGAGNLDLAGRE